MAENSSNQGTSDSEGPKDQLQDPVWGEGATQAVNVVRVDELQDTITELMRKAWENLPSSSGDGVMKPLASGKRFFLSLSG